jgi:hypothetical protein
MAPTVSSWLQLAQQAEHLQKMTNHSLGGGDPSGDSRQGSSGQQSGPKERRKKKEKYRLDQGLSQTSGPSMVRNPAPQNKDVTCYTCGQKGHYAGNRQCSKYDEWARDNPEKARAREAAAKAQREMHQAFAVADKLPSRLAANSKDSGKGKVKS